MRKNNCSTPSPAQAPFLTDSLTSYLPTETQVNHLAQTACPSPPLPGPSCATNPGITIRDRYCWDATPAQHSQGWTGIQQGIPHPTTSWITLPGGLEVVVEPRTRAQPLIISNSSPSPISFTPQCPQCQSLEHICPNCLEYHFPYCHAWALGHTQHSCCYT